VRQCENTSFHAVHWTVNTGGYNPANYDYVISNCNCCWNCTEACSTNRTSTALQVFTIVFIIPVIIIIVVIATSSPLIHSASSAVDITPGVLFVHNYHDRLSEAGCHLSLYFRCPRTKRVQVPRYTRARQCVWRMPLMWWCHCVNITSRNKWGCSSLQTLRRQFRFQSNQNYARYRCIDNHYTTFGCKPLWNTDKINPNSLHH